MTMSSFLGEFGSELRDRTHKNAECPTIMRE